METLPGSFKGLDILTESESRVTFTDTAVLLAVELTNQTGGHEGPKLKYHNVPAYLAYRDRRNSDFYCYKPAGPEKGTSI